MKYLNFLKSSIDKEARMLWNWVFEHLIFLVQIVINFESLRKKIKLKRSRKTFNIWCIFNNPCPFFQIHHHESVWFWPRVPDQAAPRNVNKTGEDWRENREIAGTQIHLVHGEDVHHEDVLIIRRLHSASLLQTATRLNQIWASKSDRNWHKRDNSPFGKKIRRPVSKLPPRSGNPSNDSSPQTPCFTKLRPANRATAPRRYSSPCNPDLHPHPCNEIVTPIPCVEKQPARIRVSSSPACSYSPAPALPRLKIQIDIVLK